VGRKADTIVSGGENVAPAEVEAALERHPAVLEAAVYGRPDPEWGEAVVARVRLRPGTAASAGELREHCTATLARFKRPREVHFTEDPLPRTPSGKLLRRELA
ncbi:MAG: fatty-acyl-CoA synthase, partial [Solirubrobacterales bacterium]|nr:fatty-acyl-CoA synthase [Solirubrobacterales bacterium]